MCWIDKRCFMEPQSTAGRRHAIDSWRAPTQQYCVARKNTFQLDELDRKLLDLLQDDAARPLYELGDLIGLSPSAVQRRLSRYRSSGVIARQIAVLDPDVVAGTVLACVLVTLERESKRLHAGFLQHLLAAAEVQQCYGLAGAWDYIVIIAADSMPRCRTVIDDLFLGTPNIKRYETLFVFDSFKRGLNIPLRRPDSTRRGAGGRT
jgi:Lrp/AsnC family transcriptional regulator, leucine-responsive regulatory protein